MVIWYYVMPVVMVVVDLIVGTGGGQNNAGNGDTNDVNRAWA